MTLWMLSVHADEVSARLLAQIGPTPTGAALAEAVGAFLRHQPWIAERVEVQACEGHAVVVARARPQHGRSAAEDPLELLRAVEGLLGMEDKLPEVLDADELPEIDVGDEDLPVPAAEGPRHARAALELLRSRARCFPLPRAEWFEIQEGQLVLTSDRIVFEPRYRMGLAEGAPTARGHSIPLSEILDVGRDTWCDVPCLRVDAADRSCRYGWPPRREDPASNFDVAEWLEKLKSITGVSGGARRDRRPG